MNLFKSQELIQSKSHGIEISFLMGVKDGELYLSVISDDFIQLNQCAGILNVKAVDDLILALTKAKEEMV